MFLASPFSKCCFEVDDTSQFLGNIEFNADRDIQSFRGIVNSVTTKQMQEKRSVLIPALQHNLIS